MIKKLIIENFRSIEKLELDLTKFNALIGPNSSGKSNILKALNLIVGETYPSVRSFDEHDFYLHKKEDKKILIEVQFDEPLTSNSNVYGFRLTYDGDNLNYLAIGKDGEILRYSPDKEIKVSNKMREEVTMIYLPLDRQAHQQITPSQWKIYGKLLKYIASKIDEEVKNDFKTDVENAFKDKITPYIDEIEEMLNDFVKEQTGLNVFLKLSLLDPTNILRDLRPRLRDSSNFEVDVELEGAGVQSAVAIAIARVYTDVIKQPLILAIEEPELFLHPHGCRHFYKLLRDLSGNRMQIIYTTHERSFVRIEDFKSICIVRKTGTKTEVFRHHSDIENLDAIKMASKFDEELNEIFFADKVILVEGPDDKIACTLALEKLEVDLDKYNISVVGCGSINEIKPIAQILKGFEIETYALVDEDPGNDDTNKKIQSIKGVLGNDKVLLQSPSLEGIFNYRQITKEYYHIIDECGGRKRKWEKFTKEVALKVLPLWFEKNEPPEVYKNLKEKLGFS
ncbi:MAG: AAA family ATPase [Deltaproteobacteria bacterium]|nr:AAA family ATPase [Deltaproteobacteria bacterium]